MADNRSISRLDRELRVVLERETPNWTKQDKKLIAFAKSHAVIFKRQVVKWKKGKYEKIFYNLWNTNNKKSVDTSALSQRWLVIKNLYLNYKAKKINLDSKFFDGRLLFLSLKEKNIKRFSRIINIQLVTAGTLATSNKIKTRVELIANESSDATQNDEEHSTFTDSIDINAPKCSDDLTDPTMINAPEKNIKKNSELINIELVKAGTLATSDVIKTRVELVANESSGATQNDEEHSTFTDSIDINAPKCSDNLTDPTMLNAPEKNIKKISKLINTELVKAGTLATSDVIKTRVESISKKSSDANQNDEEYSTFSDSIGKNAPKCSDDLTDPTMINASEKSKATTQSSPKIPSNVEVYKPGSLVSGVYLEIQPDLKITEIEAFYLYKNHFGNNLNDEKCLIKRNTSKSNMPVSFTGTVSVEDALATINAGNKDACEESITLYSVNADNIDADTSVAAREVKQATSSNELENVNVLIDPIADTRDFFRGIGKYVANKYPDKKQNEIFLEVCSLITDAELELLGDDE